ncbi:hypothetical protein GCM10009846_03460 [Agrococcus versicolor]|uniref:ABC transporter domain-containing protein n=1 Tax=Agrococcus versicolor TaxID=501482 RepID=A0ABP5MBT9_9MICO
MLTFEGVSRSFGAVHALSDVCFQARSGEVTGLLGPNGSGKTTALRILVALERADAGRALIDGRAFAELESPMSSAAALLDARAAHPGRKAIDHLKALALTHDIGMDRVHDVLELTGIEDVGHRRIGTYSLGMRQRLGIAALLLGDPTSCSR